VGKTIAPLYIKAENKAENQSGTIRECKIFCYCAEAIGFVKAFMQGSAELFAGESFAQFCSAWKLD
jgi:hypothetical protein